ncbi:MAG TPA: hypothetical protein VJT80_22900 [Steroidobacteraceae bacterium]|nr:hypothetical protein [Steroidobacteraceae bacterium]
MFKVIVERPRKWKGGDGAADRQRRDFEGPPQLGMRAGYDYRALNENLNPLRRYLRAQVGRPWSKVYSEIAHNIDRRNTVQQHIYQHLDQFVAITVVWKDGRLVDVSSGFWRWDRHSLHQELYVDPRTGLLRVNEQHGGWRRSLRKRALECQAKIDARRRTLDEFTQLHLLDGEWYEVRLARLPTRARGDAQLFDVITKRVVPREISDGREERARQYGSHDLYAVSKRQLSKREKKSYGLPGTPC